MPSRRKLVALPAIAAALALVVPAPLAAQQAPAAVASEADIDALLARMTTAEKLGQLVQRMGGRQRALNSRLGPEDPSWR